MSNLAPRRLLRLTLLMMLVLLAGCAGRDEPPAEPPSFSAAIEEAVQRMLNDYPDLHRYTPMVAATFVDIDNLKRSSTFGRIGSELFSSELARAGIPVREVKMRNSLYIEESVGELIAHHLEEQGFDPEVFTHYTAEILFDALRAPLMIDGGALPSSAELDGANEGGPATAREVSFLVPIPQAPERTLGAVSPPDIKVDKGYFTGEIDLIFERDGRVYIADWKSDTRVGGESYDREILREHVEKHYRKQVAVYTTALMRMLGIEDEETYEERFGGFFYLFVRGMNKASDEGQFFERLSWEEAQALHQRFIDSEATPADAIEAWAPTDEGKKA